MIGAREGAVKAISNLVGSNVTNVVLYFLDDKDYKGIDECTLFDTIKANIASIDWPEAADVLD